MEIDFRARESASSAKCRRAWTLSAHRRGGEQVNILTFSTRAREIATDVAAKRGLAGVHDVTLTYKRNRLHPPMRATSFAAIYDTARLFKQRHVFKHIAFFLETSLAT